MAEELLSAQEAARRLGTNARSLRRKAQRAEGDPELRRVGGTWAAPEAWWARQAVRAYRRRQAEEE